MLGCFIECTIGFFVLIDYFVIYLLFVFNAIIRSYFIMRINKLYPQLFDVAL